MFCALASGAHGVLPPYAGKVFIYQLLLQREASEARFRGEINIDNLQQNNNDATAKNIIFSPIGYAKMNMISRTQSISIYAHNCLKRAYI